MLNTFQSDPAEVRDAGDAALPDTGGPELGTLVWGLLATVSGAALIFGARRRRATGGFGLE